MTLRILGIHDGHNASAALLVDGVVKWAIQEERMIKKKNAMGFPHGAVERIFVLEKINMDDIDLVVFSSKFMPPPFDPRDIIQRYKEQYTSIKNRTWMRMVEFGRNNMTGMYNKKLEEKREPRIKELQKHGTPKKTEFLDHHLCHAATAYYGAPFPKSEDILVLTCDGGGDDLCSTVYMGRAGKMEKLAETNEGNSIGNIYSRTTFMMGLVPLEHEYKVMGMAPYADPKRSEHAYNAFNSYLDIDPNNPMCLKRNIPEPTSQIYPRLRQDMELQRFDNISSGLQKFTEEILVKWVKKCIEKTKVHTVALAGGVFMNVKANKAILELPEVEKLFVFPSCSDESLAIGAAYYCYTEMMSAQGENKLPEAIGPYYLGDQFTEKDVLDALGKRNFSYEKMQDIDKEVGNLISENNIVARCNGRMEFGARALGNRSILCDPQQLDNIRVVNMMVKKRDFWMPFAPVMLKERESDYILNPKNYDAHYMIMAFDTTDKRNEIIGAVQQSDLTARPQTVVEDWNPGYYKILKTFEANTGRGSILNTSFNLHGFPIVRTPEEAIWVLENSGLNYLAVGDYIVSKG